MATTVTKKDGSVQPFEEGKIKASIELACEDAGLSDERTAQVVAQVLPAALGVAQAAESIASSEIGDAVLVQLDMTEPGAAEAWRKHSASKE
ncbi:MAG: hypothetical protein HY482_02815 [Candidatus Wildermuthbacteria bacterium]|nr:hypothetical protein [Candidatus Wildermuthbacteria bacterium]